MAPLKYPIGTQSFEALRTEGWAYVDKTAYVYQLANNSRHIFLSRPRRFGKSLLLSTFEAYFEGKKELFDDLELGKLEKDWTSYPVFHFDFGAIATENTSQLEKEIHHYLGKLEKKFGVENNTSNHSIGARFGDLIQNVYEKSGKKVVVLIDEYDKGIVDILKNEEQLQKNISIMRPFFVQLKSMDRYLRFVFLTGVTRFRNLTLFSSPNQFKDISIAPQYAAICGFTSEELHSVFFEGIKNLAKSESLTLQEAKHKLKIKYDGYRFTRDNIHVYNPFSILNCLDEGMLDNYWLASGGSSKIFIDYLKNSHYNLEEIEKQWVSSSTMGGPFSTEDPIPLLFQAGYLTIADYDSEMYRLKIPNGEVRSALIDQLVPLYLDVKSDAAQFLVIQIYKMIKNGDIEDLMALFQHIISKFPHQLFRHNDVEYVYHLAISLICQMAGVNAISEVSVAGGDIDMVIETEKYIYVIEFKKDHSALSALQQIDTNAYTLPWKIDNRNIIKVGVEFSSANRNIIDWIIQKS